MSLLKVATDRYFATMTPGCIITLNGKMMVTNHIDVTFSNNALHLVVGNSMDKSNLTQLFLSVFLILM